MDLDRDLNPEQRQAVLHGQGPLLILAGAGSGKTRVITYRIAHLIRERDVSAHEILAVTFTNKAAGEMKERVAGLVDDFHTPWISTFHSLGARILRRHADLLGWQKDFIIYDDDDSKRLGLNVLHELNLDPQVHKVDKMLRLVEGAKHRLKGPGQGGLKDHQAAKFYLRYQQKLQQANAFDFSDLIFQLHRLWSSYGDVLADYKDRFSHVLVDEFQDTDRAQYGLLRMLCGRRANLCVVGDDDQSIYMWRDADVSNILGFKRDYPEAAVVKLERNYRSSANILEAAAKVIAHNTKRHEKKLWTESDPGPEVEIEFLQNEREEAEEVVRRIHDASQAGQNLDQLAIFYRMNAQSRALEEALRLYGVPYLIVGGTRFFDRKEIRDLMAYLRLIHNPKSDLDLLRAINVPARGIGKVSKEHLQQKALQADSCIFEILNDENLAELRAAQRKKVLGFAELIGKLRKAAQKLDAASLISRTLEDSGYAAALVADDDLEAQGRHENIKELVTAASDFAELSGDSSLTAFLEHVALVTAVDLAGADSEAVNLMTLHAAKGLEFDWVFMVGLEEGLLPHYRVLQPEFEDWQIGGGVEEERRLCYVGMTRARQRLQLSFVRARTIFGRTEQNPPSRFLDDLLAEKWSAGFRDEDEDEEYTWDRRPGLLDDARAVRRKKAAEPRSNVIDLSDVDLDEDDDIVVDYSEDFDQSGDYDQRPAEQRSWVGLRIEHATFGLGRVRYASQSRLGLKLEIDFEQFGRKTVLSKYVRPVI
jgi:ATP-dependent DNA helicase UvrD/PcrA